MIQHQTQNHKKFVIIGGGVAGLCAAIRLSELGESPLLIEGGTYPSHKICGEFLSPECLHHLESWKIFPVPINQITLNSATRNSRFLFPSSAGGLSHLHLDPSLADYAAERGVEIKTETQVSSFHSKKHAKDRHVIHLASGETIEASHVILATGRLPNDHQKKPEMCYMGFKAHFGGLPIDAGTIEMFSLPGAYMGLSPIENGKYNVACLANIKKMKGIDPLLFIEHLISQDPRLHHILSEGKNLFERWMVGAVPAFGIKKTPDWLDAYFIGDAAVTIPPACGNGLTMAILGGRLAAEYAVRQEAQDFKSMWTKRCTTQMFWAKILHRLMLNPSMSAPLIQLTKHFPFIANKFFDLTRHS